MIEIALYEPDIPQNTGTILRLGACLGVPVHIIEPTGFILDDKRLRRAGMDYLAHADWQRHDSWSAFAAWRAETGQRLLLLTVQGSVPHHQYRYQAGDILLAGRESAGVPEAVHAAANGRVRVPMQPDLRSINVAMATALVVGEALRQTGGFDRLS